MISPANALFYDGLERRDPAGVAQRAADLERWLVPSDAVAEIEIRQMQAILRQRAAQLLSAAAKKP